MVQILSGLITYLLLAIYCQEQHGESVSIRRVRQLRNQIRNEAAQQTIEQTTVQNRERKKHFKRLKKPHAISEPPRQVDSQVEDRQARRPGAGTG